ncbi:MAG: S8 family serine peptidase [Bacteroidota bacterium]|nr:S8 family serine peptidase [Bacteroidota bacterium]
MSSLFLISFVVYLLSLAFSESTLSYKLLILFRDMLILGFISQFFNLVKKNSLVVLVGAVVVYGLLQFVGFNMLFDTFPQVNNSVSESNDEFELLIETENGEIPKSYDRLIKKYGLTIQSAFHPADESLSRLDEFLVLGIPDNAEDNTKEIFRELQRAEGTEYVEYNEVITLEVQNAETTYSAVTAKYVNDPMVSQQWGWDKIQGDRVHEMLSSGNLKPQKKILIAIIDSGVDATHPDLNGHFLTSDSQNDTDPLGHGTHCAGIAGAISNNGIGIASLLPNASYVQVTSVKVMNAMGVGNHQLTISGMIKAADMGADVISMSLGGLSNDSRQRAYEEAVKYANAKGSIVVAAAGNSNQNAKGYAPANAQGVITVSAIGADLSKAPFSNSVNDIKYGVAAPGVRIMSTYPNAQYKELDGTSMATPMVAGLIGLLKSFNPKLTTKEVYDILHDTGKKLSDDRTGRFIQAADALERVID